MDKVVRFGQQFIPIFKRARGFDVDTSKNLPVRGLLTDSGNHVAFKTKLEFK